TMRLKGGDMSDPSRMSKQELARQARQHLDSLKSAGLDWLPLSPAQMALVASELAEHGANAKPQAMDESQAAISDRLSAASKEKSETAFAGNMPRAASNSSVVNVNGPEPMTETKPAKSNLTIEQRKQELKLLVDKVCQCAL